MMKAVFHPPVFPPLQKKRKPWVGACFALLIVAGWSLTFVLLGGLSGTLIDSEPFRQIESGNYAAATPSALYALFLGLLFGAGNAIQGFNGGVLACALVQALLVASVFVYAIFWLYTKGGPLWLCLLITVLVAAFVPFARAVVQPQVGVLSIVCVFLVTVRLIDATADNCAGLRRTVPLCVLLTLLSVLLLLDPSMLPVVVLTLLALCLTPSRVKGRLGSLAFIMLALCLIVLFVVYPSFGGAESAVSARVWESFSVRIEPLHLSVPIVTLALLAWVLLCRRPRYLLPFVPFLACGLSAALLQAPYAMDMGLFYGVFIFTLPFLVLIPFTQEYRESKGALRRRFYALRAGIPEEERDQRANVACLALLEEIGEAVKREDGYIGLYVAQGAEMTLNHFAVRLGALGYRTAYPLMTSDSEMSFFTTLGVSDDVLLDSLLENDPFSSVSGADPGGLIHVKPSELSALVVPGVLFDRDRYRIGRGRGCYDRYLARLEKQIPTWGVGFREQLVDSVPVEDHDQRLSGVVVM
jgi:5-formyltetrahydrofolate cyclo-ligase